MSITSMALPEEEGWIAPGWGTGGVPGLSSGTAKPVGLGAAG